MSASQTNRDLLESLSNRKEKGNYIRITSFSSGDKVRRFLLSVSDFLSQINENSSLLSDKVFAKIREGLENHASSYSFFLEDKYYVVDYIGGQRTIFILGAGHVGKALAVLGTSSGFHIVLIDDRELFLRRVIELDTRINCSLVNFSAPFESLTPNSNSAIVIVTRGHQYDSVALRQALKTEAQYIGMIGSKRRVLSIIQSLKQSQLSAVEEQKLEQLYAPIGLDIGARLPEEIAISILAQIIKVMNSVRINEKH
ncbi:MAG: XdhC family protein [Acidobacteria bacterium]|nr:XdhC family protein [Acidobacteriota bacterium]